MTKNLKEKVSNFIEKFFLNKKWRCSYCGKEIFDGYFCAECKEKLPLIDGYKCNHCGRKTRSPEEYCITCKNKSVHLDMARSPFSYEGIICDLVKAFKFYNKRYLKSMFADYMANVYIKNFMCADVMTYVPMTEKEYKKRGYNQSKLLAEDLQKRLDIPLEDLIVKKKETPRQVGLGANERLKNLTDAFSVINKNAVKDKSVLIVDDVTTTGATGEAIASKLKKAGAKSVLLITVASTPSKTGL